MNLELTMRIDLVLYALIVFALVAATAVLIPACSLRSPSAQANSMTADKAARLSVTGETSQPQVQRVGGDLDAQVEQLDGQYRVGACRITTPLPEGYPDPTPPGAIDIKRYPLVRRAEISGSMNPDWGMNFGFFPLFNHIKRRDIAMTSPVEMNYEGMSEANAKSPSSWTMSFLYREPNMAPEGVDPKDKRVLVEDIAPMTVLAMGVQGSYKISRVNESLASLREWLSTQTDWVEDGDPRALFYNGPEARASDKWGEVQIPIRRR